MKKLMVANLKMNFTKDEMIDYIKGIKNQISNNFEVVICPSFVYLSMFQNFDYKIGAQDVFYLDQGSYTGAVSPTQLKSLGVSHIIVGHSERREYFKEDDLLIGKKIKAVLNQNIKPIFCIGETLTERQLKKTTNILKNQLLIALKNISKEEITDIIIAYEPVWAIGSGVTPSINEIKEVILYIKKIIMNKYNLDIKVLYGGSVNKENIKSIINLEEVAGLLIGSSSLDSNYFIDMLNLIA
jgi:triosephosphate isomerase